VAAAPISGPYVGFAGAVFYGEVGGDATAFSIFLIIA
jgi:hypothetical protein